MDNEKYKDGDVNKLFIMGFAENVAEVNIYIYIYTLYTCIHLQ